MIKLFRKTLSAESIQSIVDKVTDASEADDQALVRTLIEPLLKSQSTQAEVAAALVKLVDRRQTSREHAVEILEQVYISHQTDAKIVGLIGEALDGARDIDDLNAAVPEDPLFAQVVLSLTRMAEESRGAEVEETVVSGLATAARMMARQCDAIAESSFQRLVELDPSDSSYRYNLGLYYKTRGGFQEGMTANLEAKRLSEESSESVEWNLGICATGAGDGALALDVWKGMGQKLELGRFELPEGGYPQCKVKLAQYPLAERTRDEDSPGIEETIWIERLSPCHGIVRSVLYYDLGVNYGDVVLIDGAPITYHKYGDTEVPVFPHLSTLVKNDYRIYDFAGTQDEADRIYDASDDFDSDVIVYTHTENMKTLCFSCWRDPDIDHEQHEPMDEHVVTGRIAAPREIKPSDLLDQLDLAFKQRKPCRIYAPKLCEDAGQVERVAFEQRRFELLKGDTS